MDNGPVLQQGFAPRAEAQNYWKTLTKILITLATVGLLLVPLIGAAPQQAPVQLGQPQGLEWAYNVPDKDAPPILAGPAPKRVPGSYKTYTEAQVNDLFNPPDWFPDEHAPMPQVVQKGSGKLVFACAACHLASGLGHPQSATLAGLPVEYLERQLADFKSGARKDFFMTPIGVNLSDDDARQAAQWFANLKPSAWMKVVEASTVPKSFVDRLLMRIPAPGVETEPLGNRIIVLPQDAERASCRDPHSGFIAYVPVGSVARGEKLVKTGGPGKIACAICHGDSFQGMGDAPRIAGLSPTYIVRQLYDIQTGARVGAMAELMQPVVARMSQNDMLAIAAYLASLVR